MSETFDPAWLALREPVDHRSRSAAAMSLLASAWRAGGWSRVVDLGSGTGSNLRYLNPRLPGARHWTLVDHDADLLARAAAPEGVEATRVVGDLATAGFDAVRQSDADLATGSALLDLVSRDWLRGLAEACRDAGCAALFALTYDGTIRWMAGDGRRPADDPEDALVRRAVNSHQRRDKGLGPALGPMAGLMAETLFREAGYRVWLLQSPWRLGPDDAVLARALVDGWESASTEELGDPLDDGADGDGAVRVRAWAARRRATIESGGFGLTVGHLDLLALPS